MSQRGILAVLLGAALALTAVQACAQLPVPQEVRGAFSAQDQTELEVRRTSLLQARTDLVARAGAHDGKCSRVASDSPLVAECRSVQARIVAAIAAYRADVVRFNELLQQRLACATAGQQAEQDRREIGRLRENMEASQAELQDWSRVNQQAQKAALLSAVKFTLGQYAGDVERVSRSVTRLDRQAKLLIGNAQRARKHASRLKYTAALDAKIEQLMLRHRSLIGKELVQASLSAEQAWTLARGTLHHEFRVASRHNEELRSLLRDPGFKDAFSGDDWDTPGADVVSTLVEQAGDDLMQSYVRLDRYVKYTGPAVKAFVFIRDSWYSALMSGLSTERVLQQSELTGEQAIAAGVMQRRYATTVNLLRACKQPL